MSTLEPFVTINSSSGGLSPQTTAKWTIVIPTSTHSQPDAFYPMLEWPCEHSLNTCVSQHRTLVRTHRCLQRQFSVTYDNYVRRISPGHSCSESNHIPNPAKGMGGKHGNLSSTARKASVDSLLPHAWAEHKRETHIWTVQPSDTRTQEKYNLYESLKGGRSTRRRNEDVGILSLLICLI